MLGGSGVVVALLNLKMDKLQSTFLRIFIVWIVIHQIEPNILRVINKLNTMRTISVYFSGFSALL